MHFLQKKRAMAVKEFYKEKGLDLAREREMR